MTLKHSHSEDLTLLKITTRLRQGDKSTSLQYDNLNRHPSRPAIAPTTELPPGPATPKVDPQPRSCHTTVNQLNLELTHPSKPFTLSLPFPKQQTHKSKFIAFIN